MAIKNARVAQEERQAHWDLTPIDDSLGPTRRGLLTPRSLVSCGAISRAPRGGLRSLWLWPLREGASDVAGPNIFLIILTIRMGGCGQSATTCTATSGNRLSAPPLKSFHVPTFFILQLSGGSLRPILQELHDRAEVLVIANQLCKRGSVLLGDPQGHISDEFFARVLDVITRVPIKLVPLDELPALRDPW